LQRSRARLRPIIADEENLSTSDAFFDFRPNQSAVRAVDLTDIGPNSGAGRERVARRSFVI
jgi:hypothetical protein